MREKYIIDWLDTPNGKIPKVATYLKLADKLGALKVRLLIGRMKYHISPGLYASGNPDADSPVLVTANYKLTFDALRKELGDIDAWILILDTKGINVWCAAGKGTFGTCELINRINQTGLEKIVNHKKLILPQLGAVGVAAHAVKANSGFTVIYGPVRAEDIPEFLQTGMKATDQMRQVRFNLHDRFVLTGAELVAWAKWLLLAIIIFFLLGGLNKEGYSISLAFANAGHSAPKLIAAYLAGVFLGPLLLPWIIGKSFSTKGFALGIVISLIFFISGHLTNGIIAISWTLLICAISSFVLMNFTGSSTYTSLSGVRKEMKIAVPIQLALALIGLILWIVARFI